VGGCGGEGGGWRVYGVDACGWVDGWQSVELLGRLGLACTRDVYGVIWDCMIEVMTRLHWTGMDLKGSYSIGS